MNESTALDILLELINQSDNLEVIKDSLESVILNLALSSMLLALIFGAFLVFILTFCIGRSFK